MAETKTTEKTKTTKRAGTAKRMPVRDKAASPKAKKIPAEMPEVGALPVVKGENAAAVKKAAGKPAVKVPPGKPAVKTPASAPAVRTAPSVPAVTEPAPAVQTAVPAAVPEKEKKHVLFVCSETAFGGTGGLAEVMSSLPAAINAGGEFEARVISPLYEAFPQELRRELEFVCHINVPLAWRNQYCGLFKYRHRGVVYYFIDNEYYFKRPNLYGYYDDGERFAYLSRAAVELLPHLGWKVDLLHCHDWQTALVPIYYKLFYMYREGYGGIRTVFTIHNIEYQGKYSRNILEDVFGIPAAEYMSIEHRGCINLMKGAIDYSDAVSTVSPTYAQEIKDPYYAHGLENVLLKNGHKLRGILNGIDVETYDPATNPALFKNYTADDPSGKAVNKTELQKMLSLPVRPDVPMIAVISRLVAHKGLDLVRFAMNDILRGDVQFVILGKGDPDYENYFSHVQKMYDQKVCAVIAYNKDLSHKIYAAADIFLMPSKSEPCGLSQMMACRYGTIPVVRLTGGLKDSIADCGDGDVGNGFTFAQYNAGDMLHALDRATGLYRDYRDKWAGLMHRAMTTDYSWTKSAAEYAAFYREMF